MLFAWMGLLRSGEQIPPAVQILAGQFIGQPVIKIHSAGPLRDKTGQKAGMLMIFEHDSLAEAESFVMDSPYLQANLYKDHRLFEYDNEDG